MKILEKTVLIKGRLKSSMINHLPDIVFKLVKQKVTLPFWLNIFGLRIRLCFY